MAGLKAPGTNHAQLFARNGVGIEGNVAGIGVLSKDQELRPVPAKVKALVHGGRVANALDYLVGAVGSGFGQYGLAAPGDIRVVRDIDGGCGAELAGEFETVLGPPHHDYPGGAGFETDGKSRQSDRAGALDDHYITPGDGRALDAMDGRP